MAVDRADLRQEPRPPRGSFLGDGLGHPRLQLPPRLGVTVPGLRRVWMRVVAPRWRSRAGPPRQDLTRYRSSSSAPPSTGASTRGENTTLWALQRL
jgi:hypothetical protein